MDFRWMAAACAAMIAGGASAQNAVQWRVQDGGNGHWYRLGASTGSIPWTTAKSEAESEGGHLATITSHPENLWVFQNIAPGPTGWDCGGDCYGPWLGGFQDTAAAEYVEPAGGWRWVTGEPWVYSAWAPGLPNNAGVQNWLHLYGAPELDGPFNPGPRWDDVEFNWHQVRSYIVEWSADCNGDGIVDYGQILTGQLADTNTNGIPDTCEPDPCPGDVTNNGVVNGTDLAAILAAWGSDGSNKFDCDIDNDGVVGGGDLAFVLAGWGACP